HQGCYLSVPPDPGIEAAGLGASEFVLPGTGPAEASHTFMLDSGASRCFFRDNTTLTPLSAPVPVRLADPSGSPVLARSSTVLLCPAVPSASLSGLYLPSFSTNLVSTAALQDAMVTTTTPWGQRVSICTYTRTGRHLATFTRRPGSSLYTLANEPPQVAASAQVSASGQVAPPCSCRLLSHQTLLWHHRLGHLSLPRLRGMHSRLLVYGLPRSLPPLLPSPAPPCLPCVEGRQRAPPHSSSFPLTSDPLRLSIWTCGDQPALVDKAASATFCCPSPAPLAVLCGPSVRLHCDRGGEFSSDLLRDFCCGEGILQSFTLAGLLLHDPCSCSPFYVAVCGPECCASAQPLAPCLLAGDLAYTALDGEGWRCVGVPVGSLLPSLPLPLCSSPTPAALPCSRSPSDRPPPPLGSCSLRCVSGAARCVASGGAASGGAEPGGAESEGGGSGGAEPRGAEIGGAEPKGVEPGGAEPEGVEPGGADSEGAESGGAEPRGTASSGGPAGASPRLSPRREPLSPQQLREWFAQRTRLRSGAAGARVSAAGDTGTGGARVIAGAGGPGGAAAAGPGGARTRGTGAAGIGGVGGVGARDPTEPGAAGAGGAGARSTHARGTGAGGAGVVDPGAGGARGTMRPLLYFVSLLQQVLGVPSSTGLTPPLLCPPPDQLQLLLKPTSRLHAPSPYTEQYGGLIEHREPASRPASPVRTGPRVPRPRPPPVPGTHTMALRPSSVPPRVPLPPPPESSLPAVPNPESDRARAASPSVSCLLATVFTDPFFESTAASALVAELVDFAAFCRLDYATALVVESEPAGPPSVGGECALGTDVLEDRQEDFECLAAAVPSLVAMLLALEGDLDAPDIPTPRSYAEAITGPYSSKWQTAMDAEMAS
ncbi:unnamed protein product, partial [Closterium sp. NIES-54]